MARTAEKLAADPATLAPLELHALAVLAREAPKTRDRLDPGDAQAVDFTLHIAGTLDVAGGQSATIRKPPAAAEILAAVFDQLGPKTAQRVGKALCGGLPDEPTPAAKAAAAIVLDALTAEVTQLRRGNVTGTLSVDKIKRRNG